MILGRSRAAFAEYGSTIMIIRSLNESIFYSLIFQTSIQDGKPACMNRHFCPLQGDGNDFRLLIQRPHATAVFSGDFDNGKSRADPLTALQRTFVGSIVPLEVFAVNNSTLSPNKLCQYLQKFNPGKTCSQKHLKCPI